MYKLNSLGKCPNCQQEDIFERKGNIFLLQVPKMHEKCSHCSYRYDKEPGYFFGAMYLSYGMAILELLFVFAATFWLLPLAWFFVAIFSTLILMSFYNYRVSREIWVKLFPY